MSACIQPGYRNGMRLTASSSARSSSLSSTSTAARLSASCCGRLAPILVGLPPLDYLARLRIRSAGRALRSTDRTVSSVATEFGYGSESAFSTAFKLTGHTPAQYRRLPAPTTGADATVPLAVGMP